MLQADKRVAEQIDGWQMQFSHCKLMEEQSHERMEACFNSKHNRLKRASLIHSSNKSMFPFSKRVDNKLTNNCWLNQKSVYDLSRSTTHLYDSHGGVDVKQADFEIGCVSGLRAVVHLCYVISK